MPSKIVLIVFKSVLLIIYWSLFIFSLYWLNYKKANWEGIYKYAPWYLTHQTNFIAGIYLTLDLYLFIKPNNIKLQKIGKILLELSLTATTFVLISYWSCIWSKNAWKDFVLQMKVASVSIHGITWFILMLDFVILCKEIYYKSFKYWCYYFLFYVTYVYILIYIYKYYQFYKYIYIYI